MSRHYCPSCNTVSQLPLPQPGKCHKCCQSSHYHVQPMTAFMVQAPYGHHDHSGCKKCGGKHESCDACGGTEEAEDCRNKEFRGVHHIATSFSAPALGSSFTITAHHANDWAVAGMELSFGELGTLKVLAAASESITVKNISIPEGTEIGECTPLIQSPGITPKPSRLIKGVPVSVAAWYRSNQCDDEDPELVEIEAVESEAPECADDIYVDVWEKVTCPCPQGEVTGWILKRMKFCDLVAACCPVNVEVADSLGDGGACILFGEDPAFPAVLPVNYSDDLYVVDFSDPAVLAVGNASNVSVNRSITNNSKCKKYIKAIIDLEAWRAAPAEGFNDDMLASVWWYWGFTGNTSSGSGTLSDTVWKQSIDGARQPVSWNAPRPDNEQPNQRAQGDTVEVSHCLNPGESINLVGLAKVYFDDSSGDGFETYTEIWHLWQEVRLECWNGAAFVPIETK